MKKNITIFILVMVMLTSACSPKTSDEAVKVIEKIDVKLALATEKYTQEEDISALPEGTLCVAGAKGESEGAQFIVKSDHAISDYNFSVSNLKNGEYIIESGAVTVQTELYSYAAYNASWSNSLPSGNYPDALIPVDYIVEAGENQIEADKNQGFFVDIKIPTDAAAGTYTGEITMDCGNQKIVIPLELKVYDFAINSVSYTKTCYLIWQNWLGYGELDSTDEKYMDYYDMMLDYNICGYTYPHTTAEEFVSYVREYYSKVPCFGIPYDAITNTVNDWDKYSAYLSELAMAAVEDGVNYFDKAYYYWDMFYDEYYAFDWRQSAMKNVFDTCDAMEEALVERLVSQKLIDSAECELAKSIRELSHVIPGAATDSALAAYNITHCADPESVDTSAEMEYYKEVTPKEIDYWWYHAIGSIDYPQPDKTINGYLISARDHFWSNYELDIIGDLYWNATGFCNWWVFDSQGSYSPLSDLYTTASHDNLSNGDGYLLYPGLAYGSDKPFASLRMVSIRDGIDDHTYMKMLGERYEQLSEVYGADTKDAKQLISFMNKSIISRQVSKLESQKLFEDRDALAKAIVLADKYGVMMEEMLVEQNELSYVIYTDDAVELTQNGDSVISDATGGGRCYRGRMEIDGSGRLRLDFTKDGETETLELLTVNSGEMISDFEEADDLTDCIVYSNYGSSVEMNTDSNYSRNGSSAKVLLSGYDFGNSDNNEQFSPGVSFSLSDKGKKLSEVESIEFWVYNPQSKDIVAESYLEGRSKEGGKISFSYDTINLHANSWTKIVVDNMNYVSRDVEMQDAYTSFGIRVPNQIGTVYSLYVDDLFIR